MASNPFDIRTDPPGRRVATGLAKVGLALKHQAWRQAGRRGLSPTQAQILTVLHLSPHGMRLAEVADRLAVSAATASEAVDALARKGLVQKTRDAADRRSLSIGLTARGRREADRAAGWPEFVAEAVEALSPPEQATFLRGLVKIIRTLQERGQIPVSQMCVTCRFFRPSVHRSPQRPHHCAYVDAPFGDRHLRLDCRDHQPADGRLREETWSQFAAAGVQPGIPSPGPRPHPAARGTPHHATRRLEA